MVISLYHYIKFSFFFNNDLNNVSLKAISFKFMHLLIISTLF
nr:MAG TPA: hypothetical protein [Caudoviricetes sp.]